MAESAGMGTGGLFVTEEMRRILAQPGRLSEKVGGKQVREMFVANSLHLNPTLFDEFALACFLGFYEKVVQMVEEHRTPVLTGTETPYQYGYATLVVLGAQRIQEGPPGSRLHVETLKYLLSHGVPGEVEDIMGWTALDHATMNHHARLDLVRLLLENGVNVDHRDRFGCAAISAPMVLKVLPSIEFLMELGASFDIVDADGYDLSKEYISLGPEVTAIVMKWLRKRRGEEDAPLTSKKCDNCGASDGVKLLECAACHLVRYCTKDCQRQHWKTHKTKCRPYAPSNTVTLKPRYQNNTSMISIADLKRSAAGIPFSPTDLHPPIDTSNLEKPKSIVIKVQVPVVSCGNRDAMQIYTRKRDFMCQVTKVDNAGSYEKVEKVVRQKGVQGLKAYFSAELRSKNELVVKVDEVLAEQPF
ncbi:hypothetical protein JAAARDRAFT_38389 [Jaapia argillacea MUCL 33604]|uniref:MYND-type domain-containing protein n=1 Tax=Jaapia argillacea MUCL 33604 TaxID=933084 RepID=A0A067PSE3_9AGAM|nr:hypothetical protein JAAARDRAFT_38389 [Jaapia argillacea MUCL 33604]